VTLTGDSGGSRAVDTPVTSPEGSDKGGKLPRPQFSPASAGHFHVIVSDARHTNQLSQFHVSVGGLPPMPAPLFP